MRVVKVLNNSLVLALDDHGQESILMGKGIGFHKAAGYEFDVSEVEKVFILHDRSVTRSIIRLANEIDSVYFDISKSIIDFAIENYHMELLNYIYLALTDHLAFAVRRFREGVFVPNFYMSDLRRFNPEEFAIGVYAVEKIRKKLKVEMPLDEAGNVAFQFINAQKNVSNREKNRQVYELTDQVMNLIKYHYKIVYDEGSADYSRFITFVRQQAQRVLIGQEYPADPSGRALSVIKENFERESDCVDIIIEFIEKNYDLELSNQEQVLLILQIRQYLIGREGDAYC